MTAFAAAILLSACSSEAPPEVTVEPQTTADPRPEIYADFTLTADLSYYTENQRKLIALLIEASQIMDDLFWRQAYDDGYEAWLESVGVDEARVFAGQNYGPWDRLDAVTYLWKEAGTSCANLPQTHAIIKLIRGVLDNSFPDVLIVTETNVPHRENIAYFGNGYDEAHMVYNFALPPLIAHSFIQGDSRRLSAWAASLTLPSDAVCFLNFSASHDGVGVRPVEEVLSAPEIEALEAAAVSAGGQVSCRTVDGEDRPYELNCTFLDLLATPGEEEQMTAARFVASQAIVLAMPGVPAIYIQSLLATRNDVARVRETGRARSINRSRLSYADVERALDDDNTLAATTYKALTRLIAARQKQPAFHPNADFQILDLGKRVFALARNNAEASSRLVTVVNLTADNVTINIDASDSGTDVLSGARINAGPYDLAAFTVLWIRCGEDEN